MNAKALDVSNIYVDGGRHVYLMARRKGSIELAEPVIIRMGWREFMKMVAVNVAALLERAGAEPPPELEPEADELARLRRG